MNKEQNNGKKIWGIPKSIVSSEKKVSILELFFDIVIVAGVSGIVLRFENFFKEIINGKSFSWTIFFFTIMLLLFLLVSWRSFTVYSSKYENDSLRHRILTLILLFFLSISTVGIWVEALEPSASFYNKNVFLWNFIGTLGSLLMIFYLNFSASFKKENKYEKRALIIKSLGVLPLSVFLISSSIIWLFVSSKRLLMISIIFWAVGFILLWICEIISKKRKYVLNVSKHYGEHIQERHSILFIIFLGEMLLQIIKATAENLIHDFDNIYVIFFKFTGSIIILFSWWWLFKELYNFSDLYNWPRRVQLFSIMMLFIYIAMVFSTVGLLFFSEEHFTNKSVHLDSGEVAKWLLFWGILSWLIVSVLILPAIQLIQKDKKFIWPKWFKPFVTSLPLLFIIFGSFIFIPSIETIYYFIFIILFFIVIIIVLTMAQIYQFKHPEKTMKDFENKINENNIKVNNFTNKLYSRYVDVELHKKHNWKLNEFSKHFEKIYLQNEKKKNI